MYLRDGLYLPYKSTFSCSRQKLNPFPPSLLQHEETQLHPYFLAECVLQPSIHLHNVLPNLMSFSLSLLQQGSRTGQNALDAGSGLPSKRGVNAPLNLLALPKVVSTSKAEEATRRLCRRRDLWRVLESQSPHHLAWRVG